jgi:homogentisate 1,2-dioxygenase
MINWLRKIGILSLLPAFAVYSTEGSAKDHIIAVVSISQAVEAIPDDGYIGRNIFVKERSLVNKRVKAARKKIRVRVKAARRRSRS